MEYQEANIVNFREPDGMRAGEFFFAYMAGFTPRLMRSQFTG